MLRLALRVGAGFIPALHGAGIGRNEFAAQVRQQGLGDGMSEAVPQRIGKYNIVREVGRGATAVVYLAQAPDEPDPVAIKLVRFKDKGKDESKWTRRLVKLLRAEATVAGRLDHPNIIRIHEAFTGEEEAYVVMEYFPGETLERYCSFEHMMPMHRAITIVFKCALALDHAYMNGIVHRDIKPANILIDAEDNVKITDFGLAMNINKKIETDSTFIMGVGSPAYMSPEQIKAYPLNQKTDLYSLGVVLFHLLAGRLPFRAANPAQLVYKIINTDPPALLQLNPDLPEGIDDVIRKALAKDLYSRYRNGAEFAKDLSAVRYKILDDSFVPPDTSRFGILRRLNLFTEFDDIEIWEILRLASWRKAGERAVIYREGDEDERFGIVLEGEIELSVRGRVVVRLGPDSVFGEQGWLDALDHRHSTTIIVSKALTYIEINPSAMALATDEVRERFRVLLASVVARRLAEAERRLAAHGEPALEADLGVSTTLSLQLADD